MSIKILLGLENSAFTEEEIMQQIQYCEQHQKESIEFSTKEGIIHIKISPINHKGIMDGYDNYYKTGEI